MDEPTSGQFVEPPIAGPSTEPLGAGRASTVAPTRQATWNDSMGQLDAYAEQARARLPLAPPALLDGYMRFAPWIAIIFGVLGIFGSVALLGLGAILSPFLLFAGAQGVSAGGALFLTLIFGLLGSVLDVVGGYLMLKRQLTGWWLLALALAVSLISSLVHAAVLSLVVILAIAYVHLSVKPNYS